MRKLLKRMFCKHEYEHVRNIYGDEIIFTGYQRSIWKCEHCDKIEYADYLWHEFSLPEEQS